MAKRKQKNCYVYLLKDGDIPLYVGKGVGGRSKASQKKHGGEIHILEDGLSDDDAFERERHWIAELSPINNISPGGNGGRCAARSKYDIPKKLVGKVSVHDWRRVVKESEKEEAEIKRIGSQRYCARYLLTRLDEGNCEEYGVSKVDLSRMREVAYG